MCVATIFPFTTFPYKRQTAAVHHKLTLQFSKKKSIQLWVFKDFMDAICNKHSADFLPTDMITTRTIIYSYGEL